MIVVRVYPSSMPVACRGRYFRRVGSTTREIGPDELGRFFVAKLGLRWDSLTEDYRLEEIDPESVRQFVRMARKRLPQAKEDESVESILQKLELIQDGRLTRGALLLFGKNPQHRFLMAEIHMGRFKEALTIIDDKLLKGNLFQQLDQAMQLFQQYLQVRFEIRGYIEEGQSMLDALRRKEIWDYPLDALREAVINALIHRDYFETSADVQIRVYDDRVWITNPGSLPEDMSVEDLKQEQHASHPRNPLLAQVFYYAELIEKWGSGTWRMAQMCREQGLPEPEFVSTPYRFEVQFNQDPYTENRLRRLGLNERQIKAVKWMKEKESISNREYQQLTGASKPTATRDLEDLVKRTVLVKAGKTGRGTHYVLKGPQTAQRDHNGIKNGSNGSEEGNDV
jgi:ATP-dependent DNA helicase RecG